MHSHLFILGGAGFVGSHLVHHWVDSPSIKTITVFDNFSSGREDFLLPNSKLRIIRDDALNRSALLEFLHSDHLVIHLASNPDISKGAIDPDLDFRDGTLITRELLEAMRLKGTKRLIYFSGSGVYGNQGDVVLDESYGPLLPVSPYGASKLASEGMIAAYCHLFHWNTTIFRPANIIGGRQTHGVGLDLLRKWKRGDNPIEVLGDGEQEKSYIHIDDVISAIEKTASTQPGVSIFNVGNDDRIKVSEIVKLCAQVAGHREVRYKGGKVGWVGDVPKVVLNSEKLRSVGWAPTLNSRDAMERSLQQLWKEMA